MAVIGSMAAILLHEREQKREIESETEGIRWVRQDIKTIYRRVTRLAMQGESVISWKEADCRRYRSLRQRTDSLLQAMKPYCREYVHPAEIDTLHTLLTDKETHLLRIMEIMERQGEADSLLVHQLPEVARRATHVRTVQRKKKGIAGALGGKKTVQILPSAKELHAFSDSLTAMQREHAKDMDAYADSLRTLGRSLNVQLNRLITNLGIWIGQVRFRNGWKHFGRFTRTESIPYCSCRLFSSGIMDWKEPAAISLFSDYFHPEEVIRNPQNKILGKNKI